jgi:tetratricopeptide (TPR) repeat protein
MFNPDMLAAAQKMMQNMTPEQLSQIAGMASKMDPGILKNMTGGNAGMPLPTATQMKEAQEKLKSMSSSEMKGMFDSASRMMNGQNSYIVNGASSLKNEGNEKVRAGDYFGAIELFKRALANLEEVSVADPAVISTQQSVRLNLALCFLKTEAYADCISVCDQVISIDPKSIKALYRRGVAKRELGDVVSSAIDLKVSMLLSEQKDEVINTEYDRTLRTVVEASDLERIDKVNLADLDMQGSTGAPKDFGVNLKKAKEIIETNPDVIGRMGDVISNLDETQLDGLLSMTGGGQPGGPDLSAMKQILKNKDFMSSMTEMMKNMDPSILSQVRADQQVPASSSAAPSIPSDSLPGDVSEIMNDPNMLKSVMTMIDTVPDEMLEDMLSKQGIEAPSFLTGARMKWIARQIMVLMRIWIFMKRCFAIILSRNGKIIIAVLVLIYGVYVQFGYLLDKKSLETNDRERTQEL